MPSSEGSLCLDGQAEKGAQVLYQTHAGDVLQHHEAFPRSTLQQLGRSFGVQGAVCWVQGPGFSSVQDRCFGSRV